MNARNNHIKDPGIPPELFALEELTTVVRVQCTKPCSVHNGQTMRQTHNGFQYVYLFIYVHTWGGVVKNKMLYILGRYKEMSLLYIF